MRKLEYHLPKLRATNEQLFELYHNRLMVDTRDIKETFGVSPQTAIRAVKAVKKHMADNDSSYTPPAEHRVPVAKLFELYEWDISAINKSVKALRKE